MSERPVSSTRQQRDFADRMASDFDAAPLHNLVHDTILDDDHLARLCDAAAATEEAYEVRRDDLSEDADYTLEVEEASGTLGFIARQRALEVVAEACATVIKDGDGWVAENIWTREKVDAAQDEARAWLQSHTIEAGRVGVLDVLSTDDGDEEVSADV